MSQEAGNLFYWYTALFYLAKIVLGNLTPNRDLLKSIVTQKSKLPGQILPVLLDLAAISREPLIQISDELRIFFNLVLQGKDENGDGEMGGYPVPVLQSKIWSGLRALRAQIGGDAVRFRTCQTLRKIYSRNLREWRSYERLSRFYENVVMPQVSTHQNSKYQDSGAEFLVQFLERLGAQVTAFFHQSSP